jgi:hypothetical protein
MLADGTKMCNVVTGDIRSRTIPDAEQGAELLSQLRADFQSFQESASAAQQAVEGARSTIASYVQTYDVSPALQKHVVPLIPQIEIKPLAYLGRGESFVRSGDDMLRVIQNHVSSGALGTAYTERLMPAANPSRVITSRVEGRGTPLLRANQLVEVLNQVKNLLHERTSQLSQMDDISPSKLRMALEELTKTDEVAGSLVEEYRSARALRDQSNIDASTAISSAQRVVNELDQTGRLS